MPDVSSQDHMLGNKTYDYLKFVALIALPALGTLYFALAQIWGLPNPEQVVGTITVVDTFLGALLHISSSSYHESDNKYDGELKLGDEKQGLVLNDDLETLVKKKEIILQIRSDLSP